MTLFFHILIHISRNFYIIFCTELQIYNIQNYKSILSFYFLFVLPLATQVKHLTFNNYPVIFLQAVDIYVTMTSSLPKDGHVVSVNVYPSEFGRECMEIEATQGPSSLIYGNDKKINDSDDDYDSDESEDDYDEAEENEKLRLYELNKLR